MCCCVVVKNVYISFYIYVDCVIYRSVFYFILVYIIIGVLVLVAGNITGLVNYIFTTRNALSFARFVEALFRRSRVL